MCWCLVSGPAVMTDIEIRKWNTQNILYRAGDCLCSAGKRQSPSVSHKSRLCLHLPIQGLQESPRAHDTWLFTAMLSLSSSDSALGQPACIICPPMWHTMFLFPRKPLYSCVCLALARGQLLGRRAGDHHAAVLCQSELLRAATPCTPSGVSWQAGCAQEFPYGVRARLPWICFPGVPAVTYQEPNSALAPWLFQHSGACESTEKKDDWMHLKFWPLYLRVYVEAKPLWK